MIFLFLNFNISIFLFMSCHISIGIWAFMLNVVCMAWSKCCSISVLVLCGLEKSFMKWSSLQLKHFFGSFDVLIWALQSTVSCDFEW